jgi:transmembrane sensor
MPLMPDHFSVEELVIDDSFINYCLHKNEADHSYWKQYINEHSLEKEKIEEAKKIVIGLNVMLEQKYSQSNFSEPAIEKSNQSFLGKFSIKKAFRYAAAVAAVFFGILITKKFVITTHSTPGKSISQITSATTLSYKTANGERKMMMLSDQTKIWLNAGSVFTVDKDFGKENRKVYLSGEALFDVVHNDSLPFVVYINKCVIKDLGTLFNVKAYPDDRQSETSLIRGKVEIELSGSAQKIFLSPNQKAIVKNDDDSFQVKEKITTPAAKVATVLPLSYNQKDSAVIETAWAQNRLEIVNEDFYHMKEKLERWFNVKINIEDDEVGKYPFTATFENEDIQQVLKALQYSYHFNYTIENNEVNISK